MVRITWLASLSAARAAALPSTFADDPAPLIGPDGRVYVFVRGADNALWYTVQNTVGD
ncbi:hypothetical protein GCM10020367_12410 [Streptomyces sannanensis]|uniref:PLL-like beta propeller domain-containing protein n=1 Tax=Streptomyces sannanensis TaxID=285536 RepID=A0ABP6S6Y0_9ACTN